MHLPMVICGSYMVYIYILIVLTKNVIMNMDNNA